MEVIFMLKTEELKLVSVWDKTFPNAFFGLYKSAASVIP